MRARTRQKASDDCGRCSSVAKTTYSIYDGNELIDETNDAGEAEEQSRAGLTVTAVTHG